LRILFFAFLKDGIEMLENKEKTYFKGWGFKNRADYENFIEETIGDLEFIAPRIFNLFQDKVSEWEQDFLKDKKGRFMAETKIPIEGKPGSLRKGSDRIAEKILESWKEYDHWKVQPGDFRGKEPTKHDPINFLNTMTDVVRFRIVCNYLSDVEYIDKKIRGFAKKTNKLQIISRDDHIETPFPKRRAGHRAIQYAMKYLGADPPVLFEIQIMTQLQHAWDKKDHHLIYEYVRIRKDKKIPVHLKNRMAAMSELLYVADDAFDSLREEITRIMERKRHAKKK